MIKALESDFTLGTVHLECTLLPGSTGFVLDITGEDLQERAKFKLTREFPTPAKAAEFLENHSGKLAMAFATSVSSATLKDIAGGLVGFAKNVIRVGSPETHEARMRATAPTDETVTLPALKPVTLEPEQIFSMGEYRDVRA